jgi:hypothetical protein
MRFLWNEVCCTFRIQQRHCYIMFQSPTLYTLLVIPEGVNVTHDGMQTSKLVSGSFPSLPPKPISSKWKIVHYSDLRFKS